MKKNHKDSYFDFGNQFKIDKNIDGYHGSMEMLEDIVNPFNLNRIKNKLIMEVGSGSGRILKNLQHFQNFAEIQSEIGRIPAKSRKKLVNI